MSFKWDEKLPYPGFKTLAKRMGITDTQARSHARSLEQKGYLVRKMRKGQTNKFDLGKLFAVLELKAEAKRKEKAIEQDALEEWDE
jgi:predicted ArsR family transcriptional regulator